MIIYINALLENIKLAKVALQYDAFTDVEFNPEKSLNCQAKACAVFVSLSRLGMIDQVKEFDSFFRLYAKAGGTGSDKKETAIVETIDAGKKSMETILHCGDRICHRTFGKGEIKKIRGDILEVDFPGVGIKTLGRLWCLENCQIVTEPETAKSEID